MNNINMLTHEQRVTICKYIFANNRRAIYIDREQVWIILKMLDSKVKEYVEKKIISYINNGKS